MEKIPDKIKKDMAMDRIGRKLCKFLEEYYESGVIEFRVAMQSPDHFIIHPMSIDGKTLDVKWDFKNAIYGNEVFGYINKGSEFDNPTQATFHNCPHCVCETKEQCNKAGYCLHDVQ